MKPPRLINLAQGSDDWHRWRAGGIGSSDIPTICGDNPYETAQHLWLVRTGQLEREKENSAMRWGKRNEDLARHELAQRLDLDLRPKCYESGEEPLLRASLDGADLDLTYIAEIKCPVTPTTFILAKEGTVAAHYYGQVQHQLFVCGNPAVCYFWVWFEHEGALVEVHPDLEYQDRAVEAALEFWDRVQSKTWPEAEPNLVLNLSEDVDWVKDATAFKEAYATEARAKHALDTVKARLTRRAGRAAFAFGGGVEVKQKKRRGAVDYARIPAVAAMDEAALDALRKPTIYYQEVSQKGRQS